MPMVYWYLMTGQVRVNRIVPIKVRDNQSGEVIQLDDHFEKSSVAAPSIIDMHRRPFSMQQVNSVSTKAAVHVYPGTRFNKASIQRHR